MCPKLHLTVPPGKKAALEVALLGLVEDRHWGGCRPRRSSEAFLVSRPRALRAGACAPLLGAGPCVSLDRLTGLTASLHCGDCPDGPVHSVWVLGRWQTRRTPRGLWLSFPTCWRSGLPGGVSSASGVGIALPGCLLLLALFLCGDLERLKCCCCLLQTL